MAELPILEILIVALAITAAVILFKERIPYRTSRTFNRDDVEQINHIIAANMPAEARAKYLDAPDKWWFVEWIEVEGGCHCVYSLDLNGMGLKGELEISGLTELTRLNCRDNALTSLKLSRLRSLTALDCQNNQMISLDLSALSGLTDLNCGNNRLLSITLPRHCSAPICLYSSDDGPPMVVLPKRVKLRTFYCQNNPLAIVAPAWRTRLVHLTPPGQQT